MKEKTIFALGFFDGVHLGHRALLSACAQLAREHQSLACAVTFDEPPAAVLQGKSPNMINTTADRVALLRAYGMDKVKVLETNQSTLSMTWQDFLADLLKQGAAGFVCGNDFRFGAKGEGTAQILQEYCREKGLACVIVPEQKMDGEKISSTRIRTQLEQGNMALAGKLLGHPYVLTGEVISGQKLGRTLEIPTANLAVPQELLVPKFGVYACKATVDGKTYLAVTNIGSRPTVDGEGIVCEVHLLDFTGDLYGKQIGLAFYEFLRPEKKFDTLEELRAEIKKNVEQTRDFFEKSE